MSQLTLVRNSSISLVLISCLGGVAWTVMAKPAQLDVISGGKIVLTEEHAGAQFTVVMVFLAIGAVISLGWGAYCAWRFQAQGPWLVAIAIFGAMIASVVCWLVGTWLGPADPATLNHLTGGESLHDKLRIGSAAVFIMWPIIAVAAAGIMTLMLPAGDRSTPQESGEHADSDDGLS